MTPEKERCEECGRRAVESRFEPGAFYVAHGGSCSQNSALNDCPRCGGKHVEMTFDRVLACIMDLRIGEAREMQQRIVERLNDP